MSNVCTCHYNLCTNNEAILYIVHIIHYTTHTHTIHCIEQQRYNVKTQNNVSHFVISNDIPLVITIEENRGMVPPVNMRNDKVFYFRMITT